MQGRGENKVQGAVPLAALGAAWLFTIHVVSPWIVRAVYAERGPAWLNAVLAGRSVHPVERYLGAWNSLAWKLDLIAALALLLFLARKPLARGRDQILRAEPVVGAGRLLELALLWGGAAGFIQALHIWVRKLVRPLDPAVFNQSVEALWMSPIGEAVSFGVVGLALVLVTRAWRRPVSLRLVTTVFAFGLLYALLRSARTGIGIWPLRLLAAGVAVQASAWFSRRPAIGVRHSRRLAAGLVAWTLATAVLLHGGRAVREWRALRSLPAADGEAPNVLLLILDTVRAQSLSLYGHERETTPRLDRIAAESLVFDRAFSPAPWTLPAHAGIVTGHLPWDLSARWNVPLGSAWPTLAERLADRGYATGGFISNYFYAGRTSGIARGFSHYEDVPLSFFMLAENAWWLANVVRKFRLQGNRRLSVAADAGAIGEAFLDWAGRTPARPFFAMLNYMEAHSPYTAPDSVTDRFTSGRPLNHLSVGRVYTSDELRDLRLAYDAAIAYIDQEIGRIMDVLRERGQLDRTLIIVTADHGEQFGEKDPGLVEHGNSLYGTAIRVPLLLRYPPGVPAGVRVDRPVSTRRIAATVMDLLEPGAESPFPGGSLLAETRATEEDEGLPVFSYVRPSSATRRTDPVHAGPMISAAWQDWHYIRNGDDREELYSIPADPWELRDLSAEPVMEPVLARLRSLAPRPPDSNPARPAGAGVRARRR